MKRVFAILAVLLIACPAFAAPIGGCNSSGLKTADAAIRTAPGWFCGAEIITNAASDAAITVYDNASAASGTVLFQGTVAAAANFGGVTFPIPIRSVNGIYVDVSGTGASYIIYFDW